MSTFVLQLSGDPGTDMWWTPWLVITIDEEVTQDEVAEVTRKLQLPEDVVMEAIEILESALRAVWPSATATHARLVFSDA